MEWKLFDDSEVPYYTQPGFFEGHGYIDPNEQVGNYQRLEMTARLIMEVAEFYHARTLTDLGCNDGGLLLRLRSKGAFDRVWGYDMGDDPLSVGRMNGLDVRKGDILKDALERGDMTSCSEVIEHLYDPHNFVRNLPASVAVFSSPWRETIDHHYEHHAWAWDVPGYRHLFEESHWCVLKHVTCYAGFQAIAVARPQHLPGRCGGKFLWVEDEAREFGTGVWPDARCDR